jgi:putative oxidoreductase
VAWGELVGGLAVAIGLLTRLAAGGLALIMLGAIATLTGANGFSLKDQGFEYNFAILVICAALILIGPGNLALDRFVRMRRKTAA